MPATDQFANICDECAFAKELIPGVIKTTGECIECHETKQISTATFTSGGHGRVRTGDESRESRATSEERIARCPHCEEEINGLSYSRSASEYGSCDLNGENCEYSDTESSDDNYYLTCPECGDELYPRDVVYEDREEEQNK